MTKIYISDRVPKIMNWLGYEVLYFVEILTDQEKETQKQCRYLQYPKHEI